MGRIDFGFFLPVNLEAKKERTIGNKEVGMGRKAEIMRNEQLLERRKLLLNCKNAWASLDSAHFFLFHLSFLLSPPPPSSLSSLSSFFPRFIIKLFQILRIIDMLRASQLCVRILKKIRKSEEIRKNRKKPSS